LGIIHVVPCLALSGSRCTISDVGSSKDNHVEHIIDAYSQNARELLYFEQKVRLGGPCKVWSKQSEWFSSVLDKTDGSRLFTETLSAKVKSVLAYETGLMGTESALTTALAIFSGTREPNSVVRHIWIVLELLDKMLLVVR